MWEAEIQIPSLGRTLPVYIREEEKGEAPSTRQLAIANALDFVLTNASHAMSAIAVKYYESISARVDLENEGIAIDPDHISNHYRLSSVIIPAIRDSQSDFVIVGADCDWEEEHGMEFVLENGRAIACGPQSSLAFGAFWDEVLAASPSERVRLLRLIPGTV